MANSQRLYNITKSRALWLDCHSLADRTTCLQTIDATTVG